MPTRREIRLFAPMLILLPGHLVAQTPPAPEHRLGLGVGFSRYQARDEVLAPLAYRGTQWAVDLSYERLGARSLQVTGVELGVGEINSSVPQHAQLGIRGQLWYGYGRRATTVRFGGRDASVHVGALFKSFAELALPQDYDNGTWIASHSLNLYLGVRDMAIGGRSLSWDVHVPLVSYVVRPPWAGWDETLFEEVRSYSSMLSAMGKRGRLAAANEYLMIFVGVAYTHALSSRFELRGRYQFWYHRYDRPREVRTAAHRLSAELGLRFGALDR